MMFGHLGTSGDPAHKNNEAVGFDTDLKSSHIKPKDTRLYRHIRRNTQRRPVLHPSPHLVLDRLEQLRAQVSNIRPANLVVFPRWAKISSNLRQQILKDIKQAVIRCKKFSVNTIPSLQSHLCFLLFWSSGLCPSSAALHCWMVEKLEKKHWLFSNFSSSFLVYWFARPRDARRYQGIAARQTNPFWRGLSGLEESHGFNRRSFQSCQIVRDRNIQLERYSRV